MRVTVIELISAPFKAVVAFVFLVKVTKQKKKNPKVIVSTTQQEKMAPAKAA